MQVSRVRMPLLVYFAVVAPVLMAALYAAEAVMGPPKPMAFASEAPVLAQRERAPAIDSSAHILTVRQGVAVPQSEIAAALPVQPVQAETPARAQVQTRPALVAQQAERLPRRQDMRGDVEPRRPVATVRSREPREVYAFERRRPLSHRVW